MNSPSFAVLGFSINDPLGKLRKKFGFDADYVPFALYDGYRTPAERAGNPNVLELEDLLITVAMNSRIGANATWSFWAGIQERQPWYTESNRLLAQLPPGLGLADAIDEQLVLLHRLFDTLCTVKGVKVAVTGKILCRKRPRSAPMLDSFVLPLACHLAMEDDGVADFEPLPWAEWYNVERALRFFRKLCQQGRQQLDSLCESFRRLPGNPELSPLRAVESLLWWESTQEPEVTDPRFLRCRKIMGWDKGGEAAEQMAAPDRQQKC